MRSQTWKNVKSITYQMHGIFHFPFCYSSTNVCVSTNINAWEESNNFKRLKENCMLIQFSFFRILINLCSVLLANKIKKIIPCQSQRSRAFHQRKICHCALYFNLSTIKNYEKHSFSIKVYNTDKWKNNKHGEGKKTKKPRISCVGECLRKFKGTSSMKLMVDCNSTNKWK